MVVFPGLMLRPCGESVRRVILALYVQLYQRSQWVVL